MMRNPINVLRKVYEMRWVLRSLPWTIYFNLHFLPFKQAIKLPIFLYKPRFGKLTGKIEIHAEHIKPGMIRLGKFQVSLYPNTGIYIHNEGRIIFEGKALIGNNSFLSIGKTGTLKIGNALLASTTLRLTSYHRIDIGENGRIGWDCLFMDTNFHKLRKEDGTFSKGYAPIIIGKNNWIANGCRILSRTKTPDFCIISAGTIVNTTVNAPEHSIIGNPRTFEILKTGIWRDLDNDTIEYE